MADYNDAKDIFRDCFLFTVNGTQEDQAEAVFTLLKGGQMVKYNKKAKPGKPQPAPGELQIFPCNETLIAKPGKPLKGKPKVMAGFDMGLNNVDRMKEVDKLKKVEEKRIKLEFKKYKASLPKAERKEAVKPDVDYGALEEKVAQISAKTFRIILKNKAKTEEVTLIADAREEAIHWLKGLAVLLASGYKRDYTVAEELNASVWYNEINMLHMNDGMKPVDQEAAKIRQRRCRDSVEVAMKRIAEDEALAAKAATYDVSLMKAHRLFESEAWDEKYDRPMYKEPTVLPKKKKGKK